MTDLTTPKSCRPARSALLLFALITSLIISRVSHADEEKNVALFNELNRRGTEAYQRQDYNTAIKDFQQAYSLKPEPLLFYNIAQCYRKINHDAEAITFYQSYLRRPETTDPELRAKAEGYLAELRGRHVAQPQVVYVEDSHEPRPKWRLALGTGLIAASVVILGFGGRALDLNGRCVETPLAPRLMCTDIADTQGLGVGLVTTGALVAIGGIITMTLPGRKYQVHRPADPSKDSAPGIVKPLAVLLTPAKEISLQAVSGF